MVIGMDRLLAPERLTGDLRATVRDHLVDVHVELGAAAGHPDVERELFVVLTVKDLVADTNDQILLGVTEPAGLVVDQRGGLLDDRIGGDHLPGDEVVADTEMLQGPLRLRPPRACRPGR